MMKKLFVTLVISLVMCSYPLLGMAKGEPAISAESYKDTMLTMLTPYMNQAIDEHLDQPKKQFVLSDAEVLDVDRLPEDGFGFNVTVRVTTYESPHDPPYGTETMTFSIDPGNIKLLSFKHE
ncbi:uncharacterized protein DUF3888 [Scopulibacillus darangshiensis]|uniref:Uncharacterized protein DUF3888 n=1 Tax=Scopulibacillus darangshiensis TaxID=442528 RepID=A0A4R2P8J2_9BACL|nr:DUF3888 domain-containing protein [Scopulibacillus darangshiensis]TCP30564.1 uncharacterized protein DUF3888 [Scopulibacillus darangshiensis]